MKYDMNNVESIAIVGLNHTYLDPTTGEIVLNVTFDNGESFEFNVPINAMDGMQVAIEHANKTHMENMMQSLDGYSNKDRINLARQILSEIGE